MASLMIARHLSHLGLHGAIEVRSRADGSDEDGQLGACTMRCCLLGPIILVWIRSTIGFAACFAKFGGTNVAAAVFRSALTYTTDFGSRFDQRSCNDCAVQNQIRSQLIMMSIGANRLRVQI